MDLTQELEKIINEMREYMAGLDDRPYYIFDNYTIDEIIELEEFRAENEYLIANPELVAESVSNSKKGRKEFVNNLVDIVFDQDARSDFFMKKHAMLVIKLANKNIDKINDMIEEERRVWKRNTKKLSRVIDELQQPLSNMDYIREQFDDLDLSYDKDKKYKDRLNDVLKQLEIYVVKKNAAYNETQEMLKQEKLLKAQQQEENKVVRKITEPVEEKEPTKIININNYEYVEQTLIDNFELIQFILNQIEFKEVFQIDEIREMADWSFIDMNGNDYQTMINSLIASIDKETDESKINEYVNYLGLFIHKYEIWLFYKEVLDKSRNICSLPNITMDEMEKIAFVQKAFTAFYTFKITDEEKYALLDEYNNTLDGIISSRKLQKSNNENMIINGLVLFDYKKDQSDNLVPYILNDLDETNKNTTIDDSIPRDKLVSKGYQDFNDLIDDITLLGAPKSLLSRNDKLSRQVRPVYKTTNAHEMINTTAANATGMIRIRPTRTSLVRFIEEKIPLKPDNKNFQIIKDLIESKFKNVIVSDTGFNLYINYMTTFKAKDTNTYIQCNKRYNSSVLGEILEKDVLSQDDIEELSKAIDATIDAYSKLSGINNGFKFNSINQMELSDSRKQ